jgi:hypothetical protein
MITGTKDKLDEIARNYICAEHKTPCGVAWHAKENSYVLRCQHDEYPEEVTRNPSLTELYKQGEPLPVVVEDNIKKGIQKRAAMLPKVPGAVTFTGVPAADLATGELLSLDMVKALITYAHKYELDPARGHVCLMYGKPYITIDGYLYHAYNTGTPCAMSSHPLNEQERTDYQIKEGDYAWLCKVKRGTDMSEFTGLGIVTVAEMTATSKKDSSQLRSPVVAAHPWQLAQKRSEWQALRRAFPIGESESEKKEGE